MKLNQIISVVVAAGLSLTAVASPVFAAPGAAISAVNVRTGPGTSYARVDALFGGEAVNIVQCQSGWCYVEHDGPDGWVSGNYLQSTGSTASTGSSSSAAENAAAAAVLGIILGTILSGSSSSPAPAPAPEPALPYGPDTCKTGYVWRDAIPGDHVCVRPVRRTKAAHENSIAGSRVNPAGAYGPNTCVVGFVWREAYSGDVVCVTPARRTQVRHENTNGPSHRVSP